MSVMYRRLDVEAEEEVEIRPCERGCGNEATENWLGHFECPEFDCVAYARAEARGEI